MTLLALAALFLRLGVTAFGGPAAHIALMRDEFVRRRGWLDDATFLDLVGAANLIPGPTSTELAMHIGHRRAGGAGLVVAGLAFLLPAVLLVGILAWLYVEGGTRPGIEAILAGIAPVVVAIIAHAGIALGRIALRTRLLTGVAAISALAALAGLPEIALLLGLGLATAILAEARRRLTDPTATGLLLGSVPDGWPLRTLAAAATSAAVVAPVAIFAEFFKIGAVLFGSGYVLVALLRSELVVSLGWITETQLLDAVAVGQVTPGPLFATATFIGYLVGGPVGATAATVGIFLPAFVAVAISIPILDRLRASARARAFLDGINAAAVGLLAVVAVQLARGALVDPMAVAVAVAALLLLIRGVGTVWLIALGAGIGAGRAIVGF